MPFCVRLCDRIEMNTLAFPTSLSSITAQLVGVWGSSHIMNLSVRQFCCFRLYSFYRIILSFAYLIAHRVMSCSLFCVSCLGKQPVLSVCFTFSLIFWIGFKTNLS